MSYNNLSVQVTSTTGAWNSATGFTYSTIALDSNIPDVDQIEVERIFDLTTVTTSSTGSPIPPIASNITTVDLRKIFLLTKTNYTLDAVNHKITAFNVTSPQKTFTFTGGGLLNGITINIPAVGEGQSITVRRKTYSLGAYVTWVSGSRLTSEQLNSQMTQLVKIVQELLYKLDSEFVKKTDFLATDAASLSASSNINMQSNFITNLNPAATYLTGYAVPMDYVIDMGWRHGVITKDGSAPTSATADINVATTATEGKSGVWFDPQDGRLKVWAGNRWVVVTSASRGPVLLRLSGTQSVTGAKTFLAATTFDSAVTMTSTLGVTSNATVGGTLGVTSNLTVDTNTLFVDATSNRVGIGTTNPSDLLHIIVPSTGTTLTGTNRLCGIHLDGTTTNDEFVGITSSGTSSAGTTQAGILFQGSNSYGTKIHFLTTNAYVDGQKNRMTLDGQGRLLINTTSLLGAGINAALQVKFDGAGFQYGMALQPTNAGDTNFIHFYNSSGTVVGSVTLSSGNTQYNVSSDYRLKKNIVPISNALSKVNLLKPCTYMWKDNETISEGFIAHELQEVIPLAVTGEKDAINDDNSIKPQGVDMSKLVPVLTAAIQELKAIVDAQASRIAALEGANNA